MIHVQPCVSGVKYLVEKPKQDFRIFEMKEEYFAKCHFPHSVACNQTGFRTLTISYDRMLSLRVLSIPVTGRVDLVRERESVLTQ